MKVEFTPEQARICDIALIEYESRLMLGMTGPHHKLSENHGSIVAIRKARGARDSIATATPSETTS